MAKTSRKEIKKQCRQIKRLWSEGLDDSQIRDRLKLSSDQWCTRLKYIANDRYDDKAVVFLRYENKAQKRYDQLEALSLVTPNDRIRLDCIKEMKEIDEKMIELGQKLGIYPKAATAVDIKEDIETRNLSMSVSAELGETPKEFAKKVTRIANEELRKKYFGPRKKITKKEIEEALK